jgi:hypothetical protein
LKIQPFKITKQVSDNLFKLNIPPYMSIYSMKKVENLHLFEPSLLDGEEVQFLPTIEDFVFHALEDMEEDTILKNEVWDTCRGK